MMDNVIKDIVDNRISDVHTSLICRVVRVSGDRADVKPIQKRVFTDGTEEEYPVLKGIKIPYQSSETSNERGNVIDEIEGKISSISSASYTTINELKNDLVPLFNDILFFIRSRSIVVEPDDKVVVVFFERSEDDNNLKRFSLSEGVILGVVT